MWWRHQMETFSALLCLCEGNSPVTGEFPSQRPVTRAALSCFFYLLLNKRLSKQSWGWWSQTPSRPWRHFNDTQPFGIGLEYVIFQHFISLRNGSDDCKMFFFNHKGFWINSLWPSDARWGQIPGSALAQVMACCLMSPSLYLNQCWLIINEVQWHSY